MPTIDISLKDFKGLVGKELSDKEFRAVLEASKIEEEGREDDTVRIKFNDTNLPYLWSVEGLARFARGFLGLRKGIPKINLGKDVRELRIESSVESVRPAIATFVAEGPALTEEMLLQLIQLQEKIAENYGRKRKSISIGLYPAQKIAFPVTYKAVDPESVAFKPLEAEKMMSLGEILKDHPKGIQYADTLKGYKRYPLLVDIKNNVLSFPPIINSDDLGKLGPGDTMIFCDATGMDQKDVSLAVNIFAYALSERGYTIHPVKSDSFTAPDLTLETIEINPASVKRLLGLEIKDMKKLLESMGYDVDKNTVSIPPYRQDIMHEVDVIEDIGIAYGYGNIEPALMESYTVGGTFPVTEFVDDIRLLAAGMGFQEVFSAMLTNKSTLYDRMNAPDEGTIEIEEYISETYSVVRTQLLPILMQMLSRNKHSDYPQKLFEQGLVSRSDGSSVEDVEQIAFVSSHNDADFTEIKAVAESLARSIGVTFEFEDAVHPSFIEGRCCKIKLKEKEIGVIGEVSPQVLSSWKLELPVSALELRLSSLFELWV